jgi:3-oxoadipate enol-lactonase
MVPATNSANFLGIPFASASSYHPSAALDKTQHPRHGSSRWEKARELTVPYAPLPGVDLWYETAGEGTPVLLIMGFGVKGGAWRRQVPALSARHRVVWFDNRGVGETRAKPRPVSLGHFADDAAGLLDHLAIERAHVVGISMGGMIAQHLALRHAHRLASLTLMATHAGGRLVVPPLPGLKRFVGAHFQRRGRGRAVLELLMTPEYLAQADHAEILRDLREELCRKSPAGRLAQLGAVLRHNTRPHLGRLGQVPTLVVQPGRDILIDPRHSADLAARIPGARLVTLPDVGHGLLRERPADVSALLLGHFAAAEAAG